MSRLVLNPIIVLLMVADPQTAAPNDDVSGVAIPEQTEASPSSSAGALLVVPRAVVGAASVPFRAGLTYYERYDVKERVLDIFFDDTRTFGIYPRLSFETRTQPGVGVRLVHKNLFGSGARVRAAADYGGEHQRRLDAAFTTPPLLAAPARLHLRGGWQRQPRLPFYGIGDGPAVVSRFGQDVSRAEAGLEVDPAGPWSFALTGTYLSRRFREETPGTLPNGSRGAEVVYGEAEVGVDTLAVGAPWISPGAPSRGTRASAFAGAATGARGDRTRYVRYGLDALQYFDLYRGDRVLLLRMHAEGVVGSDENIPFTDLPRLGGPQFLRGYTRDRFSDHVAVLGSIEYRYPIWRELAGFVFVDAGRVAPDLGALSGRFRPGAGGGLELYSTDAFRMRTQLAGSAEGLFFHLALEAVYRQSTPPYRI
jgi:hypothetical protein